MHSSGVLLLSSPPEAVYSFGFARHFVFFCAFKNEMPKSQIRPDMTIVRVKGKTGRKNRAQIFFRPFFFLPSGFAAKFSPGFSVLFFSVFWPSLLAQFSSSAKTHVELSGVLQYRK